MSSGLTGLWRRGQHARWGLVRKCRGQDPLVWDWCTQGDWIHWDHHPGTRLPDRVRQIDAHIPTLHHLSLNWVCWLCLVLFQEWLCVILLPGFQQRHQGVDYHPRWVLWLGEFSCTVLPHNDVSHCIICWYISTTTSSLLWACGMMFCSIFSNTPTPWLTSLPCRFHSAPLLYPVVFR